MQYNEKYETIVIREDKSSVAIVKADISRPMSHCDFFTAVCNAVTKWVENTDAGEKAFEDSVKDFNVGDLEDCLGDSDLISFLEEEGIAYLRIKLVAVCEGNSYWTYDTHLVGEIN